MDVKIKGVPFTLHPRKDAPRWNEVAHDIYGAYCKPSRFKVAAWNDCKRMALRLGARDICICGVNSQTFGVMFDFVHPDTGELMRAHITRDYNHLYYL